MDPEFNFLLQIRGEKLMTIYDPEILQQHTIEAFYTGAHRNLVHLPEYEAAAHPFNLHPGEGVHVPITAPHWLKNGDNVSISFSITFQTPESTARTKLHQANARLRSTGLHPLRIGKSQGWDNAMLLANAAINKSRRLLGKVSATTTAR